MGARRGWTSPTVATCVGLAPTTRQVRSGKWNAWKGVGSLRMTPGRPHTVERCEEERARPSPPKSQSLEPLKCIPDLRRRTPLPSDSDTCCFTQSATVMHQTDRETSVAPAVDLRYTKPVYAVPPTSFSPP
jgi:hypothetical protein